MFSSKSLFGFILKNKFEITAISICIIFAVAGTLVSLNRFWQYEISLIDFGQYDQAIWKISRFQEPVIYHFIHGKINVLGDHFTPSVFLIAPIYWLTDRSESILIIQAVAVAISGIFLFEIGKTVLKDKLLALAVLVSYFLFVGLQNAVITEFHELTVMTLPFMITFWALVKNKIGLYLVFLVLTLGFKEVTFSLGIGLGVALILLKKEWRKIGLITIIVSIIWGILSLKLLIPYFNQGKYLYDSAIPSGITEKVTALFDQPEKRHTVFYSFFSFSFLPILSPEFWLLILQDYATRFLPSGFVTRWGMGLHYNAQSAVILSLASIYGLKRLLSIRFVNKYKVFIGVLIILNSIIIFRFILHGPFLLATNPAFFTHTKDFKFLDQIIEKVPKDAYIMTQNNLATRFTHQEVRLVSASYADSNPDFILLDVRDGQNPNNYFGSGNIDEILLKLKEDNKYVIVYETQDQYLFKRK